MLVMTGAGFGCCMSDKLESKYKSIKSVTYMLNDIYIMLESASLTKAEIIERIKSKNNYVMFQKYMSENNVITIKNSLLSKDDEKELIQYFNQLGTTDLYGQLSKTNLCINEFKQREEILKEKLKRCGKLYRGLGVIGGAAAAILVI